MCDFVLMDGSIRHEAEFPGGWRDFPFKSAVKAIRLYDRTINPTLLLGPAVETKGFAVHWIGMANLANGETEDVVREIMIVLSTGKVKVYSLHLKTLKWSDYEDDLNEPKSPHLFEYDLKIHGIKL